MDLRKKKRHSMTLIQNFSLIKLSFTIHFHSHHIPSFLLSLSFENSSNNSIVRVKKVYLLVLCDNYIIFDKCLHLLFWKHQFAGKIYEVFLKKKKKKTKKLPFFFFSIWSSSLICSFWWWMLLRVKKIN